MIASQLDKIKAAFPNAEITEFKPQTWIVKGDGLYLRISELQICTDPPPDTDWG